MTHIILRAKIISITDTATRTYLHSALRAAVPVCVSIAKNEDGSYFLFHENEAGVAIYDSWHETLEEAQEQAANDYVIEPWHAPLSDTTC